MHTVQNDIILACIQGFNDTFNIIIINIFRAAGYDIGRKFARFKGSCLAGGFRAGDAPLEKFEILNLQRWVFLQFESQN